MNKNYFLLGVALCGAASALGAHPKGEKLDTLHTYMLQDVQVTSTRASEKTPMAFKNISQQQIRAVNFGQDIPYLLSLTPSVTTTSDAGNGIGYTSIRIRGVDPSRINITANGIPMNDAESSQVYWVNMGDFASSLQSMQIQRGAGTSTNGAGAFGATLNMQTENIGATPYLALDLAAGSYYSHKETLRFGTGLLGGHWGIQGRLSNIGSKGYLDRRVDQTQFLFPARRYFSDRTMVKFITFNGNEETYHAWNMHRNMSRVCMDAVTIRVANTTMLMAMCTTTKPDRQLSSAKLPVAVGPDCQRQLEL
jgi:iron complex outermembrane receptor protein